MMPAMPVGFIEQVGQRTTNALAAFGDFARFVARTFANIGPSWLRWRNFRAIIPQMYDVGTKSVPVVSITGAFIGMVLAVESYTQFRSIGQETRLGSVIKMNVTEQIDALRVMGADPIRVLVIPRFLACIFLTPLLTIYSDFLGVVGGWLISVQSLDIPSDPYWRYSSVGVDNWQLFEGIIKSVFFGAAIALIGCYKGFTCGAGASGVGRACTESFVASFMAIIILNFFFAQVSKDWYLAIYGVRSMFG
jgi:phospholipid/cholesterol/gamma-HCH transport system permease protein